MHLIGFILAVLVPVFTSCNSANFQGTGNTKGPDVAKRGGQGGGQGGSTVSGNPGNGSGGGAGGGGADNGGDPGSGINTACLAKKANDYNIVVVVDTSFSMLTTDPQNLRSQAVSKFAANLETFAKSAEGRSIQMAVIGFSRDARRGANSPVDLGRDGSDKIAQDIGDLTRLNGLGTNFSAGLQAARQALSEMGAQKNKKNQRNFVVFLSDGEPNRGSSGNRPARELAGEINNAVTSLADDLDAAMISIASGSDINQQGLDIIQGMAQHSSSTIHQDHKGQFIRVDSDDDLEGLSKELGQAISGC